MITEQLWPAILVLTMSMAHQIKMDLIQMDTLDYMMRSAQVEWSILLKILVWFGMEHHHNVRLTY